MPPSQHDPLADDLRSRLAQSDQAAEIELAQRYNQPRRKTDPNRVRVPNRGDPYSRYDDRLLAMLWAVAGNQGALRALGATRGLAIPDPLPNPVWPSLDDAALQLLWDFGRDGPALQELWTRQGVLPAGPLQETPDHVLGFLAWYHQDAAAREALLYRHHEVRNSDAGQDRVQVLLHVVSRWDYRNWPNFRPLLLRSIRNNAITRARRNKIASTQTISELSDEGTPYDPADLLAPAPDAGAGERDELGASPLELRALYKVRLNSEESPQELNGEERDHLARLNLAGALDGQSAAEQRQLLDQEGERIERWMAEHPLPTGKLIRTILPGYNDSKFTIGVRSFRLGQTADQLNRLLGVVLRGSPSEIEDEAVQMQEAVDELVQRSRSESRRPGTVPLFAGLSAGWLRLRQWLLGLQLDQGRREEARTECLRLVATFLQEFPVLLKLSACSRLTDFLIAAHAPPPPAGVLAGLRRWLDEGHWLSSFGKEHRAQAQLFAGQLRDVLTHLPAGAGRAPEQLLHWLGLTQQAGAPPDLWRELEDLRQATHALPASPLARWSAQVVALIDLALGNQPAHLADQARKLAGLVCPNGSCGPERALQLSLDRLARAARSGGGPSLAVGG